MLAGYYNCEFSAEELEGSRALFSYERWHSSTFPCITNQALCCINNPTMLTGCIIDLTIFVSNHQISEHLACIPTVICNCDFFSVRGHPFKTYVKFHTFFTPPLSTAVHVGSHWQLTDSKYVLGIKGNKVQYGPSFMYIQIFANSCLYV